MTQLNINWEFVADRVMGGVSTGTLRHEEFKDRAAFVLRGDVSLDNNGGFIQMASNLNEDGREMDVSGWRGLEVEVSGNGETYDFRLRTDDLDRPWQSYRCDFKTTENWSTLRLPFADFEAHKTDIPFDAAKLRRVGILAIGHEFTAEIAVASVRLYRGSP